VQKQLAESIDLPFGVWTRVGQRKHEFNRIRQLAPMYTISIVFARWRQRTRRHSAVSCAKRLNRSIYRLGCGLGWTEGSTSSIIFARWRQCAHMGGHIWRHLANTIEPSVYGGNAVLCQITLTTCFICCYNYMYIIQKSSLSHHHLVSVQFFFSTIVSVSVTSYVT